MFVIVGPIDIQKDHCKKQRQEEKNVWSFHRDPSTAHIIGGLSHVLFLQCFYEQNYEQN